MPLTKRRLFEISFVCALPIMVVSYFWYLAGMTGGGVSDTSPNGHYSLSAMAPLSPTDGGSYQISLTDAETSEVIRHITVSLPDSEQTVALRGGGGAIVWHSTNEFVDLQVSETNVIRIWVPQSPVGASVGRIQ
jgi:hypothetical protein